MTISRITRIAVSEHSQAQFFFKTLDSAIPDGTRSIKLTYYYHYQSSTPSFTSFALREHTEQHTKAHSNHNEKEGGRKMGRKDNGKHDMWSCSEWDLCVCAESLFINVFQR